MPKDLRRESRNSRDTTGLFKRLFIFHVYQQSVAAHVLLRLPPNGTTSMEASLSLSRTAADTATPHLPHWCSSIASSRALNESSRLLFRPVDSDILLRRSPSSKRRNLVFLKSMTNVNQLGCITSLPISSDWPELRLSSYSFLIYSRGTRADKGS